MRRAPLATIVALGLVVLAGALFTEGPDPGPVPTCNGAQATIVLVSEGTEGDYQAWADAGVEIRTNPDNTLIGTRGHDVLVGVSANSHLIVIYNFKPFFSKTNRPTAGDFMCNLSTTSPKDSQYYGSGFADVMIDSNGGSDVYYTGGCALNGAGTDTDKACDVVTALGDTQANMDKFWGSRVPRGRIQRFAAGSEWDHFYAGGGPGRVVISAGSNPTAVPGGGDHVHPCPITQTTKRGFTLDGIEYFGPSLPFGDDNNPCAYTTSNA